MDFFAETTSENLFVVPEIYSAGIEIEFTIPDYTVWEKYSENCHHQKTGILGFDCGIPGSTCEYRSPVFMSVNPDEAFNQMFDFSLEVQNFLIKDYNAVFRPYFNMICCGTHFSLGGKFYTEEYLDKYLDRLAVYFRNEPRFISDEIKIEFRDRRSSWLANPPHNKTAFIKEHHSGNLAKFQQNRIEFRFLPSMLIHSAKQHLKYLVLADRFPLNKFEFSKIPTI